MSDTIILTSDFGKYSSGQEFKLIKKASSTYLVENPKGSGRLVIPAKYVNDTPSKTIMELSQDQWDGLYKPLLESGDGLDVHALAEDYKVKYNPSMPTDMVIKDIVAIDEHMKAGNDFFNRDSVVKASEPVKGAMSEKEISVLEAMMTKPPSEWTDETFKVKGVEVKEEVPELGPNQIWFTDITDGRKPKSGINHIINVYPSEHFSEDLKIDIPKIDPLHYWDTEVLECLVLAYSLREKALITGLPGTGKSTSVEQFAAWVKQPYLRLGGRGDLESSGFLGYAWADVEEVEGEHVSKMVFKPGLLTQGVQNGYLVTIDEVMKIPSYIQMAMQHLYEKDGYLTVDDMPGTKADKVVHPAPSFLMILTDNVKGTGDNFDKFGATQIQDTSTLDRISLNETLDYLPPTNEAKMLRTKYPMADKLVVTKLVKFAGLIRNGYKQGEIALTMSPRGLIAILSMVTNGLPIKRAIDLAFLNKIADESEAIAIKDMMKTVGLK